MNEFWRRTRFGVRTNWRRGVAAGFAAVGVGWSTVEAASFFLRDPEWLKDPPWLLPLIIVGVVVAILATHRPTRVHFDLATTHTRVEIRFGDLFNSPGHRVIPMSEFFDTELGQIVEPKTVHGQFIERHFDGQEQALHSAVQSDLASVEATHVPDRAAGNKDSYPIGTTARVEVDGGAYLLVAITTMHPDTHEASADVAQLWLGLSQLWQAARARANGDTISVPLVGGGLARVGLPPTSILQLLMLSLVVENKKKEVAKDIHIVLADNVYEAVDLRLIEKEWT